MWNSAFAGQMRKSPFSFSSIGDTSPLLWLARRYAILDGPTMPIVAEGDEEPNNTYVEQLTASARAAVQVALMPSHCLSINLVLISLLYKACLNGCQQVPLRLRLYPVGRHRPLPLPTAD